MDQMIDHYAQLVAWCERAWAYYADHAASDGANDDPTRDAKADLRKLAYVMLDVRGQIADLGRSITVARLESGEIG